MPRVTSGSTISESFSGQAGTLGNGCNAVNDELEFTRR